MTRPNRDLWQAGAALQDYIATNYQQARAHLALELSYCDGFAAKGGDELRVSGAGATIHVPADEHGPAERIPVTGVEAQMIARTDLQRIDMELEALKVETLAMVRLLNEAIVKANSHRAPRATKPDTKKQCCATGQVGKEGAIEWGDPLCLLPQVKGGMCQGHYYKWYRHRQDHGIDTSRDFEPA